MSARRWLVLVLAIFCVIALIAWARGRIHFRGDDVGALGHGPAATAALVVSG